MFENERYGQKNGKGFYAYEMDKRGKPKKVVSEETYQLLEPHVDARKELATSILLTGGSWSSCSIRC